MTGIATKASGRPAKFLEPGDHRADGRLDDLLRFRGRSGWGATQNWLSKKWVDFMRLRWGSTRPRWVSRSRGSWTKTTPPMPAVSRKASRNPSWPASARVTRIANAKIDQDRDAVLGGLDQAKREETDRRHAAYAKQLRASQAAVDAARKEFDDARKEAADKRAAKEAVKRRPRITPARMGFFSAGPRWDAWGQDQRRRHLQCRGRFGAGLRRRAFSSK